MLKLGPPELILLLIIAGVLRINDPRQRKVMLMVFLAALIITAVLPAHFFAVVAVLVGSIAAVGMAYLLKRA